jgi:5-methylcytosine-specific restriction endonuclease McrA
LSNVFVLDTNKRPLNPVHPGRARMLLSSGKAAVFKRYPFTIILTCAVEGPGIDPLRIKIDPGSKVSGIAVLNDATGEVVFAAELAHRGAAIKKALDDRRAVRRSRRQRHTRYRKPRYANRRRRDGWLAPSLESRLANILTWVKRLLRLAPITAISQELVRFDTQMMQNPEVSGVLYQQGERAGYELREYLLEKWQRRCAYCGKQQIPLQLEHIVARARGGSDRASNLTLACAACNGAKGTQEVEVFLAKKPEVVKRLLAQAEAPLKDAAAGNVTRWALYERLKAVGLPVETGSGGLTKYNRAQRGLPKSHWLDAANIGKSTPVVLVVDQVRPLQIQATGHGTRRMCGVNECGFPIRHRSRRKWHFGFQTGMMVQAMVPSGSKGGTYTGRVLVRASGSFDIQTNQGRVQGISHRFCRAVYRSDGYRYQQSVGGNSSPA